LECFPNPILQKGYSKGYVEIVAPEFTSLCPKTGQPDFAVIVVRYAPDLFCVESKSFKLYLGAFRQHGMFHEACVQKICDDLAGVMNPLWISVEGRFTPRGGIKFWPVATWDREGSLPVDRAQHPMVQVRNHFNVGGKNE
jgi:7-cyano-7-deazaguanine reductase